MLRVFFLQVFTEIGEIGAIPGKADGNIVHFILDAELNDIVLVIGADGG